MQSVEWAVTLLVAYSLAGLVFAVAFVSVGIQRIDAQARGSSVAFRLIVLPAAMALWPMLLRRWSQSRPGGREQ